MYLKLSQREVEDAPESTYTELDDDQVWLLENNVLDLVLIENATNVFM